MENSDYIEDGWENRLKLNESDNESYNSCASRHNFWEDVNIGVGDGEYKDTMFREDKRKCS